MASFLRIPVDNGQAVNAMPAIDITPEVQGETIDPSLMQTVTAAFRQENLIGSMLAQNDLGGGPDDPDYDFWSDIQGTQYEAYADSFAKKAWNRSQGAALKSQIDRELEDRRTLDASGWTGTLASLGAAVLSPENLLPVGGVVASGRLGFSVSKSALLTGASGALAAGVSEIGLHATQEVRTGTESAFAIGGSALLGGILGAGMAQLGNRSVMKQFAKAIDADINRTVDVDPQVANERMVGEIFGSAGAAGVKRDTLDDLSIAGKAAETVGEWTQFNPLLRALNSPSVAYRRITEGLMENPIYLRKNFEGSATQAAAETLVKEYTQGKLSVAVEGMGKIYKDYRKGGGMLKAAEFNEAVGKAMRRGDVSDDPNIAKAAQMWRKEVFDPLKDRAIEVGLLPPDVSVETAVSYLSRVYNRPKIEANEAAFKGIVRDWLSKEYDTSTVKANKRFDRKLNNLQSQAQEAEMRINRRNAEIQARENGDEVIVDTADEGSVVEMLRRLQAGEKINGPETFSQWLKRQAKDGIYDAGGDVAQIWPEGKKIPGLFRKTRKTIGNSKGGLGLDELTQRAWDEGFLEGTERPSINEMLDLLSDDIKGGYRVRIEDEPLAYAARDLRAVEEALARIGVDVSEGRVKFGTSDSMKDIAAKVANVLDEMDRAEIDRLKKQVAEVSEKHRADIPEFVNQADKDNYLKEIIDEIFNNVTGRGSDGDVPRDIVASKRGPLKERTFNIPDELIEDFLESDVEAVGRRYARMMAADVELQAKYGSTTLEPQIKEIREDFTRLREQLDKSDMDGAKKERARKRLDAEEKTAVEDLKAIRDQLRGTYLAGANSTNFARFANGAQTFNYLRTMGGVTLSSLTDIGRHVMVHGMSNVMKDGLGPLIKNMQAVKLSVNEAKLAGTIAERILNTRMAAWAELVDPYNARSPFERFLENTSRGFSKLNGMVYWNDFQKSFASVLTQSRILRDVTAMGTIKPKERAYLAFLGIDENMADRIAKEFESHGQTIDGVRVANTENWADDGARRAYRAAINKDVDSTIVTKGIGDIPLWWKTPAGRMLTQFKTFAMASHQRAFIRGMQEGKAGVVSGLMTATTVGMLIYYLKSVEANRMDDISDNPGRWIAEGIDRSGMLSIFFELNNMYEKFGGTGAYSVLQSMFPDKDQTGKSSRYMNRSLTQTVGGPTMVFMDTLVHAVQEMGNGDFNEKDVKALRNIAPFASLPVIKSIVEYGLMPTAMDAARN